MKREDRLIRALQEIFSSVEIERFLAYRASEQELRTIAEMAKAILERTPRIPYVCAMMSALWGAMIRGHTAIPVAVIAGHLDINGRRVFQCETMIPTPTEGEQVLLEQWDGHCWIEFGGYIGDISLCRTIDSEQVPGDVHQHLQKLFGSRRGALRATPKELESVGLIYTPIGVLSKSLVDGLVYGAELIMKRGER